MLNLVGSLLRAWPYRRFVGQIADLAPVALFCPPGIRITHLRAGGGKILTNPSDYVGRRIYLTGCMDRWVDAYCEESVQFGDTVVDIGANWGAVTIRLANAVGSTGSVHAFEPQPILSRSLVHSARLNGFDHVRVHEIALGDRTGEALFFQRCATNLGMGALTGKGDSFTIRIRHAGQYLNGLDLSNVGLLKLDTEGHEFVILTAALDWLRSVRPRTIVFEALNDHAVSDLLSELGYSVKRIHGSDFAATL